MRCFHGPCIAALHVWVALTDPGRVRVCLRFAVGAGSSGVCMFHVLIPMPSLVFNCEVLWASLVRLGFIEVVRLLLLLLLCIIIIIIIIIIT